MVDLAHALLTDEIVGLPRDLSSPDGAVDMYEAALADPDPATAIARLRGHGFVAGALRCWSDGDNIVQVTLHRFSTHRDAELAATEQAFAVLASAGVPFSATTNFRTSGTDGSDNSDAAMFGATITDSSGSPEFAPFVAHVVVQPLQHVMALVLAGGPLFRDVDAVNLMHAQVQRLAD
jgi:hypothetical protein